MSHIHFCSDCNSITYLYVKTDDSEEVSEDHRDYLIHHCKNCGKNEKFENKNNCIYEHSFKKFDSSVLINVNKYITQDPTLPKIKNNINIKCPNAECESILENKPSEITYIKYNSEDMKYIYICDFCGQKWKNN